MDSPQLFLAFGALMLVVALLGVAIDWFGKPLKHRKFIPKAYRFPDERQPRHSQVRQTEWSDASLILPVVEPPNAQLVRYPDASIAGEVAAGTQTPTPPPRDVGPPTAQVPIVGVVAGVDSEQPPIVTVEDLSDGDSHLDDPLSHIVTLEDVEGSPATDSADERHETAPGDQTGPTLVSDGSEDPGDTQAQRDQAADNTLATEKDHAGTNDAGEPNPDDGTEAERARGWNAGQYIFNLTPDGSEPSPTTVRTRYWKNVAATAGASIFGQDNVERMASGKAPRRLNHRSGKSESMRLPTIGYHESGGSTPVPQWPVSEVDPFA